MLDQDTGGGIREARVDLFLGDDDEARRAAAVMKRPGSLWYLVPREDQRGGARPTTRP